MHVVSAYCTTYHADRHYSKMNWDALMELCVFHPWERLALVHLIWEFNTIDWQHTDHCKARSTTNAGHSIKNLRAPLACCWHTYPLLPQSSLPITDSSFKAPSAGSSFYAAYLSTAYQTLFIAYILHIIYPLLSDPSQPDAKIKTKRTKYFWE